MEASKILLGLAALTLLSGCATTSRYEAKVRSWDGKNAQALVRNWGQPDDIEKLSNGDKIYVYARLHHEPVAFGEVHRSLASVSPAPASTVYIQCSTYFKIDPGNTIVGSFFRGDDCKSSD